MKKILAILLTLVFVSGVFAYAAPFPDLPADHWATEAVKVLAEKGLVEGYPNGTFKGNRAATRYEVAMVVARLIAYLEKRPQVTKEDLEAIKRLVDEFKDELDAMGVRLKNVEDLLADLERRVTELERVRFSGGFETRYVTSQRSTCAGCTTTPFQFDTTAIGTRLPFEDQNLLWDNVDLHLANRESNLDVEGYPVDRVYTAFPTNSGSALTQGGYLKVEANLGSEYSAGGVVSFYNNVGYLGNGYIYGTTPNTIANPFELSTSTATFGTNLSANVNQIFLTDKQRNINISLGDWRPAFIPDNILQGLPNMGVFGPDYLPFYGGQVYGKTGGDEGSGLRYEAVAGSIAGSATALLHAPTYENELFGGALGYSWRNQGALLANVDLTGAFVRALNDGATAAGIPGGIENVGDWANPTTPLSEGSLALGPQTENMVGADLKLKFGQSLKWVTLEGKYANSSYNASVGTPGISMANGNMVAAKLSVDTGKITGGGEYLWVAPTFDPFIAQVNIPNTSFSGAINYLGLPYPVSYGPPYTNPLGFGFTQNTNDGGDVFYNLHDAREYPDNRTGYRTWLNWNFGSGNLGGRYEDLRQVVISSLPASLQPGFYEPIFGVSETSAGVQLPSAFTQPAGPFKGLVRTFSLNGDYTFASKAWTLDGIYMNSRIFRPAADLNNIDLLFSWWRAGLTYRPTEKWSFVGGYDQFNSGGSGRYDLSVIDAINVSYGKSYGTVLPGGVFQPNYLFRQFGPYFGANYAFTKNASAWFLYRTFNMHDNTFSGNAGFAAQQLQSGMNFLF